MISNFDDVYLIDGATGDFVATLGADIELGDLMDVQVQENDARYTLDEATSHVLMLPEANRLIIFDYDDYEQGTERVTALDLISGDTPWHHGEYRYSRQLYEQFTEQDQLIVEQDPGGTRTGGAVGLVLHDDEVVVVGENGVGAFDRHDGTQRFESETERVTGFHHRNERLVLEVEPTGIVSIFDRQGGAPDDIPAGPDTYDPHGDEPLGSSDLSENPAGVITLDLAIGSLGNLAAWEGRPRLFGAFSGTSAVVDDERRHTWIFDENGTLLRYFP